MSFDRRLTEKDRRPPKESFEQAFRAFRGYSPGGVIQPSSIAPDAEPVLYLQRSNVESRPDWRHCLAILRSDCPLLCGSTRVEVVDELPVRLLYHQAFSPTGEAIGPLKTMRLGPRGWYAVEKGTPHDSSHATSMSVVRDDRPHDRELPQASAAGVRA